jgi:NDP-sugar pyrophosphorylase family protein
VSDPHSRPDLPRDAIVHDSAEIEEGATLGSDVRIWRRTHVRTGAVIGAGASLGANVFIDKDVVIGARAKIQNNVSVYEGVELGDEVFVGPAAVFTNDLNPRATGAWRLAATVVRSGASIGAARWCPDRRTGRSTSGARSARTERPSRRTSPCLLSRPRCRGPRRRESSTE